MTQIEVSFDEETLREVLFGDRGAEVLLEEIMNEVLQAEMTEHLGAKPGGFSVLPLFGERLEKPEVRTCRRKPTLVHEKSPDGSAKAAGAEIRADRTGHTGGHKDIVPSDCVPEG